jgi:hypothetical protein
MEARSGQFIGERGEVRKPVLKIKLDFSPH